MPQNSGFDAFMRQNIGGLDAAIKKYVPPDPEGAARINKERDEIKKDEDKIDFPTAPPEKKNDDPVQALGSSTAWMAMLGSVLTKHPLQSALTTGAAAINAAKAGNEQAYQDSIEKWKANNETIKNQQEWILNKLKSAGSDEELRVQAQALGFPGVDSIFRTPGGIKQFMELYEKNFGQWLKYSKSTPQDLEKILKNKVAMGAVSEKMEKASYVRDAMEQWQKDNPKATKLELDQKRLEFQNQANEIVKGGVPEDSEKTKTDIDSLKGNEIVPHTGMTKDAIDYAAKAFNLNDTKTALAGLAAVRSKGEAMTAKQTILNRAAELREQGGVSGPADVAATGADIKGLSAAIVQQEKQNASIETFANTAKDNLNNALKLAKEGGIPADMGPWLNRYVQEGEKALGDPNIPPFQFALLTGVSEAAKVLSGSMGAAAATDSARKEVAEGFNSAYDYKTLENVVRKVVDVDIKNRTTENANTLKDLRSKIANEGKSTKKTPNAKHIKMLKEASDKEQAKEEFDEYFGKGAADKALAK